MPASGRAAPKGGSEWIARDKLPAEPTDGTTRSTPSCLARPTSRDAGRPWQSFPPRPRPQTVMDGAIGPKLGAPFRLLDQQPQLVEPLRQAFGPASKATNPLGVVNA